jgi:hypothetical protein
VRARAMTMTGQAIIGLWVAGSVLMSEDVRAQGVPFEQLRGEIEALATQLDLEHQALADKLMAIDTKLNALAQVEHLVPFKVEAPGGICNTAAAPSANPEILIDSDGDDPFVVTSIIVKTAAQNPGDYEFLSINSVRIDGLLFDTRTQNLTAPVDGFAVDESADLMGTPIRRSNVSVGDDPGGNFPHQIVAEGAGADDIEIRLFCRADTVDLDIDTVLVAGWTLPGDQITAVYVPGN